MSIQKLTITMIGSREYLVEPIISKQDLKKSKYAPESVKIGVANTMPDRRWYVTNHWNVPPTRHQTFEAALIWAAKFCWREFE